jgi:hypothetical protein
MHIIKWILNKEVVKMSFGFVYLRAAMGRVQWRAIVSRVMNVLFHKQWGTSMFVERILVFNEGSSA